MPAAAETFSTPVKWFFVFADVDEKFTLTACIVRLCRMLNETGTATVVFDDWPPSCGRTLRISLSA
jgi:hypothetical protein